MSEAAMQPAVEQEARTLGWVPQEDFRGDKSRWVDAETFVQRGHEIMDLLWKLNVDHGITVLMVTHEADMAAYAKRIVRFVDGVVAHDERNLHPAGLDRPSAVSMPDANLQEAA